MNEKVKVDGEVEVGKDEKMKGRGQRGRRKRLGEDRGGKAWRDSLTCCLCSGK
jgi:hypothetical protein